MDLIYVQVEKLYTTLFQSSDPLDFSLIAWQFTKIVKSFFFFFFFTTPRDRDFKRKNQTIVLITKPLTNTLIIPTLRDSSIVLIGYYVSPFGLYSGHGEF